MYIKSKIFNKGTLFSAVFMIFFITSFFIYPIAQTVGQDELATIGWSALFAGRDWSEILSYRKYYGFGYAFFLTPLFYITDSPLIIYRGMLVFNGVLNGVIALLAYDTLMMINQEKQKTSSFWLAMVMPFIPLKFINIINETAILCVIWGTIYISLLALKEPQKKVRNSIAISCVLLYGLTIHTRLILLVVLVVLLFLLAYAIKTVHAVNFKLLGCNLVIGYIIINKFIIDKLMRKYGISSNLAEGSFSNTADGLRDVLILKVSRIFSFNGIKSICITVFGQIATGNIVMCGIVLSSLIIGIIYILKFSIKEEKNILLLFGLCFIAVGGACLMIIGQAVTSLPDFNMYNEKELLEVLLSRRTNVYLRYYNIYVGPLLASSFFIFKQYSLKMKKYITIFTVMTSSILGKLFLLFYGDKYFKQSVFSKSPTYNIFALGGVITDNKKLTIEVIGVMVIISMVLLLIVIFFMRKKETYSIAIISIYFIFLYLLNVKYVHYPNSLNLYNKNIGFYEILGSILDKEDLPQIVYLPEKDTEDYRIQLFLNKYSLKYAKPDENEEAIMIYRAKKNIDCTNVEIYEIENCGYIVVQGEKIKKKFENARKK